jgi:hypothetical protein
MPLVAALLTDDVLPMPIIGTGRKEYVDGTPRRRHTVTIAK